MRALALIVVAGAAACVIPPTQSSIGGVGTAAGAGTRASIGAHASALDDRGAVPIDLGAGWIVEDVAARGTTHGTYLAVLARVHGPLWLGGRAEQWWGTSLGQPARGLAARFAARRRLGGVRWGSTSGGALGVLGAVAAGAFVDVGARQLDGGGGELFGALGVTLELPALASDAKGPAVLPR